MILLGAGSSVPFGIPGMEGFVTRFLNQGILLWPDLNECVNSIKGAIDESVTAIGFRLTFDLETLLAVLSDLSGDAKKKPISIPTATLLLKESLNIEKARLKYSDKATLTLDRLREFIFSECMQPIENGKEKGNFGTLDWFYGPLMTLLNRTGLENIQAPLRNIYSTNWDLCFKTWMDYTNTPISDGVGIDKQSFPVFDVTEFDRDATRTKYVALHGSLDLVGVSRPKGSGIYRDIQKISDPLGYFQGKPANIRSIFMIYPLEAVGYEESVKSPYLDLLNHFKNALRSEDHIVVIGYSFRDPTIGSIFEEVIGERIRKGHLRPLSEDLNSRKNEVRNHTMKIIVINPSPEKLAENMKKQSHANLLQTFVPIKVRFPEVSDPEFFVNYKLALSELGKDLEAIGYLSSDDRLRIAKTLNSRYAQFRTPGENWWGL
jgi:hypothetical protein